VLEGWVRGAWICLTSSPQPQYDGGAAAAHSYAPPYAAQAAYPPPYGYPPAPGAAAAPYGYPPAAGYGGYDYSQQAYYYPPTYGAAYGYYQAQAQPQQPQQ
jgi:sortase A